MANEDSNDGYHVGNTQVNMQMGPLQENARSDDTNTPTIPHNNMPPYVEVYIWECMEA